MSIKYQQGDVLLVAVPNNDNLENPQYENVKTPDKDNKFILAEGEGTGHHHRFEVDKLDPAVVITLIHEREGMWAKRNTISKLPSFIRIEGGPATLYHEEHHPITLPPGLYRRSIVREFDYLVNKTRKVVD